MEINWLMEVEKRKSSLLDDTKKLLEIKSVLDEVNTSEDAPLGLGVKEALDFMLEIGKKDGFNTKNVGNLAGYIEFGQGEECVGILCHVDVVPEGDGWLSDPFKPEIRDGKIFARGAMDDKGPTMAAYYAMKIVKECNLPINKRVRMIIGTDEESNWRCVNHYFEHEEMPTVGFAPDADFPIIFAEKGIADFDLVLEEKSEHRIENKDKILLLQFESGRRYNMVPDYAKAILHIKLDQLDFIKKYEEFLEINQLKGKYDLNNEECILEMEGVSAHGMEPDNGKNAGLYLAEFLHLNQLDDQGTQYAGFASNYLNKDSRGKHLNINYFDDISGELTINVGKMKYDHQNGGMFGLNVRYPVTNNMEKTKEQLVKVANKFGFKLENFADSKPHHVEQNSELIQILQKVYEEQTGEKAELLAIGGGTYARSLTSGVAFGPLFPGREDVAHQKDEYMYIDDLLKAAAIYAQAIYELAK